MGRGTAYVTKRGQPNFLSFRLKIGMVFRGAEHEYDIYFTIWGILITMWGTFTKIYQSKFMLNFLI